MCACVCVRVCGGWMVAPLQRGQEVCCSCVCVYVSYEVLKYRSLSIDPVLIVTGKIAITVRHVLTVSVLKKL